MCHYRHHAHADPFLWPAAGHHCCTSISAPSRSRRRLDLLGYASQAQFLINAASPNCSPQYRPRMPRAMRRWPRRRSNCCRRRKWASCSRSSRWAGASPVRCGILPRRPFAHAVARPPGSAIMMAAMPMRPPACAVFHRRVADRQPGAGRGLPAVAQAQYLWSQSPMDACSNASCRRRSSLRNCPSRIPQARGWWRVIACNAITCPTRRCILLRAAAVIERMVWRMQGKGTWAR